MLRTNLSTRPFYNERVVHLLIALAGVIVLAITLFNVVKVMELSRHNTELSTPDRRATGPRRERLTREAARIRRGIDQKELTLVAAAAREANALIDQRTFSWTAFFNHLEATLPPDVMLVSVRPTVERGATRVSMVVLGRSAEDIDEFIEKLEATGAFEHVLPRQQDRTDDGLNRAVLEVDTRSTRTDAAPAKPASSAAAAAPPTPGPAKPGQRSRDRSRATQAGPGPADRREAPEARS